MQRLHFEPSWEKTIALEDRELITEIFRGSNLKDDANIRLEPIWEAKNYKGEVLITVLIHNFMDTDLTFQNKKITYVENKAIIAEYIFTIPQLFIEPKTSLPWTFIFPVESFKIDKFHGNGKLLIDRND